MEQDFEVILDLISKDFDSVPHVPLLHHLKDTGLNPYIDVLLLIKPIKDANDYISLQQDITTITNTHTCTM